jgi:hypothetical protein
MSNCWYLVQTPKQKHIEDPVTEIPLPAFATGFTQYNLSDIYNFTRTLTGSFTEHTIAILDSRGIKDSTVLFHHFSSCTKIWTQWRVSFLEAAVWQGQLIMNDYILFNECTPGTYDFGYTDDEGIFHTPPYLLHLEKRVLSDEEFVRYERAYRSNVTGSSGAEALRSGDIIASVL